MTTSVISFLVVTFRFAAANVDAQGPDQELAKLKGTWIASAVSRNGERKTDVFETRLRSLLMFDSESKASFLNGQLGAPTPFGHRETATVQVDPKQKQLVFSFAANETKGNQKASVSCSYTLKEGDRTDELVLNFEEGNQSETWTFYRARPPAKKK